MVYWAKEGVAFMQRVYFLGGSTCCGKSTVAERLCAERGWTLYKLDDDLEPFMAEAARRGYPASARAMALSPEDTWMRSPEEQNREELAIYREMFDQVCAAIAALGRARPVLAEGAGLLPELARRLGVDAGHACFLAPTARFQRETYAKRPWVGRIVGPCSDPQRAFDNWMARDALFAQEVLAQARRWGYPAMVVDGSRPIEDTYRFVADCFARAQPYGKTRA